MMRARAASKSGPPTGVPVKDLSSLVLNFSDVLGFGASRIFFHLKAHPVTFGETLESGHNDGRVVDKYIPTAVLTDEPKSSFLTEPLYRSLGHILDLHFKSYNYGDRP
jgi:hypothetical protein